MKQRNNRFTLVEILMVSGMICLIAALIAVAYNGVYRSWATGNTIATMKGAHLALDKYMLENAAYPTQGSFASLETVATGKDLLISDLLQNCAPYSQKTTNSVQIFDDFSDKESMQHIQYRFPVPGSTSFALRSAGKDGSFGSEDDIIYLPSGNATLKPGFYMGAMAADGTVSNPEPLAQ